ncbi:MAG: Na+/H+ antiporter [Zoogloeaceae bacterium]|jgi:CPA1 family monovalent cation:H+ antiporter|nr:Na+/H+ antiporter [Zoogloeaceae bacterium]
MHTVEIVLLVLMLGAVTGIAARYLPAIPLPLIQIVMGAVISWPQHGLHIAFDPDLFLLLFIPPLLFADGWRIPKREFFGFWQPVLQLALGLVLFTVLGLGLFIHWLIPSMPLPVAFALAAVVSPTDAVAVSAITRNLGMPAKTMSVLEGESLLNDASGLVALKFTVAAAITGAFSWSNALVNFMWIALAGLAVGAALGWGYAVLREQVTRQLGDIAATQMVVLMVLLPFAAYLLGDHIGASGILAAVAAGVTTNLADLKRSDFIGERMRSEATWTMIESSFNGAVFLLLGLQLPSIITATLADERMGMGELSAYVIVLTAALLALRWFWFALGLQGRHLHALIASRPHQDAVNAAGRRRNAWLISVISTFAGIRGAVTLAGALSIPLLAGGGHPFPERNLLIFLATGTILCTLILGSIGLPLLLKRLPRAAENPEEREERQARLAACRAAVSGLTLSEKEREQADPQWLAQYQEAAGRLLHDYHKRIDLLDDNVGATTLEAEAQLPAVLRERRQRYIVQLELHLKCLHIERAAMYAARRDGRINDNVLRRLAVEVDLSEVSLQQRLAVARRTLAKMPAAAPPPNGGAAVKKE